MILTPNNSTLNVGGSNALLWPTLNSSVINVSLCGGGRHVLPLCGPSIMVASLTIEDDGPNSPTVYYLPSCPSFLCSHC